MIPDTIPPIIGPRDLLEWAQHATQYTNKRYIYLGGLPIRAISGFEEAESGDLERLMTVPGFNGAPGAVLVSSTLIFEDVVASGAAPLVEP
jgi:hypothetical protein